MTFLVPHGPASVLRLGAAVLLAASALFGTTTSTVGDPATACAAPRFDQESYAFCVKGAMARWARGEYTEEQYEKALFDCCYGFGGEWDFATESCFDPAKDPPEAGPQLPGFPDLGEPTATLTPAPPPAGPIAPSLSPAQIG